MEGKNSLKTIVSYIAKKIKIIVNQQNNPSEPKV